MLDLDINNIGNVISDIFYYFFITTVIILASLLIISLIALIIGCLIKSQKIKSKFLLVVPGIVIVNILFLSFPCIFVLIKSYVLKM